MVVTHHGLLAIGIEEGLGVVRVVGLPLSLWSQKIFTKIGNRCRGFIETEEETCLKDHLYWARIKVKGDGEKVPRELKISIGGLVYNIPIWFEMPVTVCTPGKGREEDEHVPLDKEPFLFNPRRNQWILHYTTWAPRMKEAFRIGRHVPWHVRRI